MLLNDVYAKCVHSNGHCSSFTGQLNYYSMKKHVVCFCRLFLQNKRDKKGIALFRLISEFAPGVEAGIIVLIL